MGKIRDFIFDYKYYILLFSLILFHVFSNVVWITLNNVPPTWDAALHTVLSIKFLDYIQAHTTNFNVLDFLRITQYYPPFVHWVGSILAFIGNGNYKTIQLSGTLFFCLSILFLFLYTDELFHNKRAAFFSTFFFSFFITVYQQSRDHMLDVPLTALVLMGLYLWKKTKLLQNKGYSILFFIIFSLAFLTKWFSVIFFAIPILFDLIPSLNTHRLGGNFIKKVIIGIIIFILINAPWYLANLPQIIQTAQVSSTAEHWNPHTLLSAENLFFHLKLIIMFQISFVGFIFFILSSLVGIRDKTYFRPTIFALVTVLITYFFFTVMQNKNIRYLIPSMPFLAMIMGLGAAKLMESKWTKIIPLILIIYYFVTYTVLSFAFPFQPNTKYSLKSPLLDYVDILYLHTYPVNLLYQSNNVPNEKILADIFALKTGKVNVLVLKDTKDLNYGNMDPYLFPQFKSRLKNFNFVWYYQIEDKITDAQIQNFLTKEVDFVLVAKSQPGLRDYIREYDSLIRFQKYFLSGKAARFTQVKQYSLTGDEFYPADTVLLYRKTL